MSTAAEVPLPNMKKAIRTALNRAGVSSIDKDVLSKCVALASTLNMSPEEMATCWEAYSLSKNVNELTTHTFEAYKTQVYKHSDVSPPPVTSSNGAVQVRNVKREKTTNMVTPPVAKRHQKGSDTPTSSVDVLAQGKVTPSSPARRTLATPLPKYEDRTKVGQVVASFNPKKLPKISPADPDGKRKCDIDTTGFSGSFNVTEPYRHMFTTIQDRAQALESHLQDMSKAIIEKYGISNGENGIAPLEQVNIPRQDTICCVGRICNEAHQGKLNSTSVVLEGTSAASGGARVNVDLSHLKSNNTSYSLFPGQIVAIEGMNATGRKLVAHRICEGAAHAPIESSIRQLRDFHYDKQDGKPVKVMTASGPFTTSDNMSYQPFMDFMHVVLEQSPDVVVLTGPFVDTRQELIKSGRAVVETDDGEEVVSFEALFAYNISALIEQVLAEENVSTQFVLVPSLDDATAKWVYPQAPLQDRGIQSSSAGLAGSLDLLSTGLKSLNEDGKPRRVHCLSNPCTFKINETVFGVTSNDVLFHVSAEETNSSLEPGSRLRRIAQHMLQQRSYYPLFPAPQALPTNLDLKKMKMWQIPCKPDVLLVPSKLTCFAAPVLDSTVVVNPGHLAKGTTGGTYGIMEIHPLQRQLLDESGGDEVRMLHGVQDRLNVEIKRI